jgi:hypothetical protein
MTAHNLEKLYIVKSPGGNKIVIPFANVIVELKHRQSQAPTENIIQIGKPYAPSRRTKYELNQLGPVMITLFQKDGH